MSLAYRQSTLAFIVGLMATVSAQAADFGENDLGGIVDASRNNEIRFNRDYKGRPFLAEGVFDGASENPLSKGVYSLSVRTKLKREEVNCVASDRKIVDAAADWNKGLPVIISGPIDSTIMGRLYLEKGCTVTPISRKSSKFQEYGWNYAKDNNVVDKDGDKLYRIEENITALDSKSVLLHVDLTCYNFKNGDSYNPVIGFYAYDSNDNLVELNRMIEEKSGKTYKKFSLEYSNIRYAMISGIEAKNGVLSPINNFVGEKDATERIVRNNTLITELDTVQGKARFLVNLDNNLVWELIGKCGWRKSQASSETASMSPADALGYIKYFESTFRESCAESFTSAVRRKGGDPTQKWVVDRLEKYCSCAVEKAKTKISLPSKTEPTIEEMNEIAAACSRSQQ